MYSEKQKYLGNKWCLLKGYQKKERNMDSNEKEIKDEMKSK